MYVCMQCLVKEERDNKTRSGFLTQPWACQRPSTQLSLRAVGPDVKACHKYGKASWEECLCKENLNEYLYLYLYICKKTMHRCTHSLTIGIKCRCRKQISEDATRNGMSMTQLNWKSNWTTSYNNRIVSSTLQVRWMARTQKLSTSSFW